MNLKSKRLKFVCGIFAMILAVSLATELNAATVKVAICQIGPRPFDIPANMAKIETYIKDAASQGAVICVFPEFADVGFEGADSGAADCAAPVPGTTSNALCALAKRYNVWISTAILEQSPGDSGNFDTSVLISNHGKLVLRQRKTWTYGTFGGERNYEGNYLDAFAVDSPWGPICVMNCADTDMPAARSYIASLEPAFVLITYAANGAGRYLTYANKVAQESHCPVVTSNHARHGSQDGGGSRIIDANGKTLWTGPFKQEALKVWDMEFDIPANRKPRLDAGSVQTIRLPANSVVLKGYAVDDGKPNGELSLTWSKVSGPGKVAFDRQQASVTTATFSEAGVYRLKLTADDGDRAEGAITSVNVLPADGGDLALGAYWPFDGDYKDYSANSNTGTPHGDPYFATDKAPTAGANSHSLDLDGFGDYVKIKSHHSLQPQNTVTISMWAKLRSINGDTWLGNTLISNGVYHWYCYRIRFMKGAHWLVGDGMKGLRIASLGDEVTGQLNRWHHIAVVFDNDRGHGRIYLNGVLDHTILGKRKDAFSGSYPVLLGSKDPNITDDKAELTDARIDEVRIHTRALSSREIAIMAGGAKVNQPPTVDAGAEQSVDLGKGAVLKGSFSDDAHPKASKAATWTFWHKISGPGEAIIDNCFDLTTSVRFTKAGVYVLELVGCDGAHRAYDTVQITAGDKSLP